MNVFLHGSPGSPPPARHTVFITPAEHLAGQEMPHEWVDSKNQPRTFQIVFEHGKADVDDQIGKYMVAHGLAFKSRLIHPQNAY